MHWIRSHVIGLSITAGVLIGGWLISSIGQRIIRSAVKNRREGYRDRKLLSTVVFVAAAIILILTWGRLIPAHGTFFGLLGAGLAIALREPLLSIAGRIAIFTGRIYDAGDRIQIGTSSGDIIDVGFFYTRMMEIGNWIHGDQYSGRILQFPNAQIFGAGVFSYTRDFPYIWDEVTLDVTYESNLDAATKIMVDAGNQYTKDFLGGAQENLRRMQEYFLVPDFELKSQVYVNVTTNWVGLTMRYVVDPKKRRSASTFLYRTIFDAIRKRDDIEIGSDTQTITYKRAEPKRPPEPPQDYGEGMQLAREQADADYDKQSLPGESLRDKKKDAA
jgi:small-conductance mechanosensitive channel